MDVEADLFDSIASIRSRRFGVGDWIVGFL